MQISFLFPPLRAILGAALVILSFSELVLFNEDPMHAVSKAGSADELAAPIAIFIVFYAIPGAAFVAMRPLLSGWIPVLLAGALIGWIIEAAVVAVAYESIPYSFIWPSVSLHAYVDVLFGCFVLRIALRRSFITALGVAVALGVAWGAWATWPWPEAQLTPAEFAQGVGVTCGLMMLGLWLMDGTSETRGLPRAVSSVILVLCLGLGAVQIVPFLPWGLMLPVLVALTFWALYRAPKRTEPLVQGSPPAPWRYTLIGLSGLLAWGVYTALYENGTGLPSDAVLPVVMLTTTLGFLAVLLRALWGRGRLT